MGWASLHNQLARAVNHAVGGVTVTCGAVTTQGILEKNAELIVNGQVISVEYALHNVPTEQFGSLLYGSGITVDDENYLVRDNLVVGDGMFCVLSLEKVLTDSGIVTDSVLDGGTATTTHFSIIADGGGA